MYKKTTDAYCFNSFNWLLNAIISSLHNMIWVITVQWSYKRRYILSMELEKTNLKSNTDNQKLVIKIL